jgi:hypothetical protein
MAMRDCKNPTCDRRGTATYCSRQCQLAMRTNTKGRMIPDVWIPMSTWWALTEAAEVRNLTVRDHVLNLIEDSL